MLQEMSYRTDQVRELFERPVRAAEPPMASIVRFVLCRCFGRMHRLEIEQHNGRLVLYGRTSTYHAKQLVQHAAMEVADGCEVENRVEVVRSARE